MRVNQMNIEIDNLINSGSKIEIEKIRNGWEGTAAGNLISALEGAISAYEKEMINLQNFQNALDLVEKCKNIDLEIKSLEATIITFSSALDESSIESHNASVKSKIQKLVDEKEEYKNKIKSLLGIVSPIQGQSASSIVLPGDLSGTIKVKYQYGAIYEFTTETGSKFEAYIPNNYDSNTKIMIYEAGNDGSGKNVNNPANWNKFKNRFEQGSCNAIVLRGMRHNAVNYYNYLVKECGLVDPQPITVSHSGGTMYSMYETNDLINQSSSNKPAIVTILDGYAPAPYLESKGIVQNFKDKNTIVLGFAQGNDNANYAVQYEGLAQKGVNVLILYDKSQYGISHGGVNNSFTEANILEYVIGEGKLPDNYEIKTYQNGQFVSVDFSQVSDLQSLYSYFGVV